MQVIALSALRRFWERADAPANSERYLRYWHEVTCAAEWRNFGELRGTFGSADVVGDCVVFDVGNNRIRLIGRARYQSERRTGMVGQGRRSASEERDMGAGATMGTTKSAARPA